MELREQDRWLPIANVSRIMKTALPENAKVSKEAKECVQECVSEFVSFITSEASEKCAAEKRKTVNGEDILFAMTSLGFENYAEVLKIYLAKYREFLMNKQEKSEKRRREGTADMSGGMTSGMGSANDQDIGSSGDMADGDQDHDGEGEIEGDDMGSGLEGGDLGGDLDVDVNAASGQHRPHEIAGIDDIQLGSGVGVDDVIKPEDDEEDVNGEDGLGLGVTINHHHTGGHDQDNEGDIYEQYSGQYMNQF